jgi:PAS domain S-box-containing protein
MPVKELRNFALLALLLALATLVANAWFLNRTAQNLQDAFGEADRVRRLLALNRDVLDSLLDAETGQRGFLLTGREDYLDFYRSALPAVPADVAQLTARFDGNRDELAKLAELQSLVHEKIAEMNRTIELRRTAGEAAARAVVMTGQGKQIMDRIRQITHEIEGIESSRLASALDARKRYAARTRLFVLAGSALLAFLVCAAFAVIRVSDAQRHKLHLEVSRARDLLETTLHSIGDGVIVTDPNGIITLMNPVACGLAGCDPGKVRGLPLRDVFHIVNEFSGAEVEDPVAKAIREGVIAGLANHTLLISSDGSRIPIDDSAAPIRHGDELVGVVLVFRDIRERRRADRPSTTGPAGSSAPLRSPAISANRSGRSASCARTKRNCAPFWSRPRKEFSPSMRAAASRWSMPRRRNCSATPATSCLGNRWRFWCRSGSAACTSAIAPTTWPLRAPGRWGRGWI